MNQRSNARTSLFLMELIVVIFFFSLASAVCVKLFVSAHLMAEKTENLSHATVWAQTVTEAFYGSNGSQKEMINLCPNAITTPETIELFFDKDWNLVNETYSDASYEILLVTRKMPASQVYADVEEYKGVSIEGEAIVGEIAAIDIRRSSTIYSEIPEDKDIVILSYSVDQYLGKEAE